MDYASEKINCLNEMNLPSNQTRGHAVFSVDTHFISKWRRDEIFDKTDVLHKNKQERDRLSRSKKKKAECVALAEWERCPKNVYHFHFK